ncbi:RimJ/RimL family protein N-acetyltransferase [Clostridium acetobutylicum]|uniref:Predicted acetyltransferase n=1 Tax=Clostridium acetobutylicum (strain ATCC 824 / DSM 792 / JCM 1419 / IAM 19013 / LMG 5710 / NBRC 13948 / NRRL B-527 / VKM B-1787 / 2291 / W) TaxID=272562 RepID=Q97G89_CLOAB|nr:MULTISPECIES: GNAT family protein [Clostridium]AAK80434.1 Predicted acetyltransferase [Clostridium acetobutylicum ATCC 824]ADZ21531.1 acetyltransferase [Clostridium acetobutylicum EA 2018]AEI32375.1 acetyltransferase [Clostridium acetobutylicum DSM 1731]AWV79149.1 N-acetyltransferase [Clostridium acetobutylicum]MBC2394888.1 GNAT family N-acetyltransferase [Clostridium acetobutylicum]
MFNSIELYLLKEEHIKRLFDWNRSEKHLEYYTCRPVKQYKSFDEYRDKILKSTEQGKKITYVLIEENSNEPLGKISLFDFNTRNRSAEIGYYLPEVNRKRGLGSIMLDKFLNKAFSEKSLNLNKIYATTASNNYASIKLLEKYDFNLDGRIRERYFIKEDKYDQLIYSILKREWKE